MTDSAKPILKLPVDSADFDDLVKKVQEFKKIIEELPDEWADQNAGVEHLKNNFEEAADQLSKMRQNAASSQLSGQSSFISRFEKSSDKAEKSWSKINRWTEKSEKNLSGIARLAIIGGARGGLFGAAAGALSGVAAGVVGGAAVAGNSLADKNAQMRALGLQPGQEEAFTTEYKPYGFGEDTLQTAAQAKRDAVFAQPLNAIGISSAEVGKLSTVELAQAIAEKIGPAFAAHNKNGMGAQWMKSTGLSNLIDPNTAQQASTYSPEAFAKTREEMAALVPKLALAQSAYDAGTEALKKFTAALKEDETSLLAVFTPLLDPLSKLAGEFSDAVVAFAKSGELQTDIDELIDVFGKLGTAAEWLSDKIAPRLETNEAQSEQLGGGLIDAWKDAKNGDWKGALNILTSPLPELSTDSLGAAQGGTTPPGAMGPVYKEKVLSAIRMNESSGKIGAVNAASGAAGLYGLMPSNSKGINVDDPVAARNRAREVLDGFLREFHGDYGRALAAYDGDTHVAADDKKYDGQYWKGAKPETINYLAKIERQGINLGLSKEEQHYIDAHASGKLRQEQKADYARTKGYQSQVTTDNTGARGAGYPGATDHFIGELTVAIQHLDKVMTGFFREGGGSQYRTPDAPPRRTSTAMHQGSLRVKVDVNTPAGADTNVTVGGLAQ
ncbi:transglycosylase-like protein with SLT domain [Paraburkholderia sp. BL27I4N3]|uniref:lytic transglycosylase domain-containing protein n=1 Tax=Paraburkholderia sp. BL27I4N3 TaxID=1938805 RepID=UPI000E236B44|nr:lytic transglycosylase domain-containing protein [Paraburkholderia sp. BL27I4N3]REE21209.1 transglycosylase-like protein with SLT domain [Paraburkholderia sp. BL27I4N3]